MSENIRFNAWRDRWAHELSREADESLQKIVDEIDTLAQTKAGEVMQLAAERDALKKAVQKTTALLREHNIEQDFVDQLEKDLQ